MTALEKGFREYAKECRLPEGQAAYIFKRASDYPLFLELIQKSPKSKEAEDLDFLSELSSQHNFDQEIRSTFKKLK